MTQGSTEAELEELDKMADFLERRVPLRQVQMLKHAIALQQHDHEAGVQALHRYFDSPASEDLQQRRDLGCTDGLSQHVLPNLQQSVGSKISLKCKAVCKQVCLTREDEQQ